MKWYDTCIFIIVILGVGFLLFSKQDNRKKLQNKNKVLRENLSESIFGDRLRECNSHTTSNSQGLLLDEAIVCNIVKDLPTTPFFNFEDFTDESSSSDWFFVNLDWTKFEKITLQTIVCKTKQAYFILSEQFPNNKVIYTGFTSIDRFIPDSPKDFRKFLHLAGQSSSKGTIPIVKTWVRNPEWPVLTIICRNDFVSEIKTLGKDSENINLLSDFLSDDTLKNLANENGIHLCLSEYEGFGHNINEARSVGSVTVYTDAPCMNEKFTNGQSGIGVKCLQKGVTDNGFCPKYIVCEEDIEEAVNFVLQTNPEKLKEMGQQARKDFLRDDADFKERLRQNIILHNYYK